MINASINRNKIPKTTKTTPVMKKSALFIILIQLLCLKDMYASDWNNSSIFNYKVFIENKGQLSHNEIFLTDPI